MTDSFKLKLLALTIGSLFLTACGDANTQIVEKEPIEETDDDHNDDDHDDGLTIESMGRLAVMESATNSLHVFDLDDNSLLDNISLAHNDMTLGTSGDFRFATAKARTEGLVQFVDGGLWRENHGDHLHDYKQGPALTDYELSGSRPTHAVIHDGQLVVFNDGDADSGAPASVQVVTDAMIASDSAPQTLVFAMNMHGVAEPRGEHLLATLRRDDADSTSNTKVLPDQVGVFHLHDGEYELEQTLELTCPDLHGAGQNHEFVAFGCSDGVLIAHQHDDEFEAEKIANIDALEGLRVGRIYGHEGSESFIGIASAHGGSQSIVVNVNAEEEEMEVIDWQAMEGATPVSYAFAFEGEHFLILDNLGYLTVLHQHEHDGHMEWEFAGRVDISEEDVSTMPEGLSFSMTVAKNGHFAYVADPIAQHVLKVHLEDMEIEGDIELDYAPAAITWLGIAEESESDHDHEH